MPFNLAQGEGGEKAIGFLRRAKREQTGKEQGVLAKKYKIESVPSVIVCDGKSGLVNAANIKTELGEEPEDGLESALRRIHVFPEGSRAARSCADSQSRHVRQNQ